MILKTHLHIGLFLTTPETSSLDLTVFVRVLQDIFNAPFIEATLLENSCHFLLLKI